MTRARFNQVNVVVGDMARSVAFYELLGADVADIVVPWADHHRELTSTTPGTSVELDSAVSAPNWAAGWAPERTGVVLGFAVDEDEDVDAVVAAVEGAGHGILQPPHDAFFGSRYAVVEDPDGNAVGIMGPMRADRRWMPTPPS
jgi:catechol 2,3-dioxygenase-like lactoylglutathione lyase family enzyme